MSSNGLSPRQLTHSRRSATTRFGARTSSVLATIGLAGGALTMVAAPAQAATQECTTTSCTVTFAAVGDAQSWTVPEGLTSATFELYGAEGGRGGGLYFTGGAGGRGAHVRATLPVVGGETISVVVGGRGRHDSTNGGFNGGGGTAGCCGTSTVAGGGGGASDIRRGDDRLLVAGGGGGGGGCSDFDRCRELEGSAGGASGSDGATAVDDQELGGRGGGAGTSTAGGFAGPYGQGIVPDRPAGAGSAGAGGVGAGSSGGDGGGGGGGYFGGGGGGGGALDWSGELDGNGGGGGGGSNLVTGVDTVTEDGVRVGDGEIVITYARPDRTAPVIAPHADVLLQSTGPGGAIGTYAAPAAVDEVDGALATTCAPPSGSTFPIGATTVTCSAADRAGNVASSAFTVTVTAPVGKKADVKVLISGPASAPVGAKVTYTMTVSNTGPAVATNLTAALNTAGLTGTTASPGGTSGVAKICGVTISGFVWTVASLPSGQTTTFTITGVVNAKKGKWVTLVGGAASTISDPDVVNNLAAFSSQAT